MKQCALYVTTGTEYSSELLEYSVVILNKVCLKKNTNDITNHFLFYFRTQKNILGNLFYDIVELSAPHYSPSYRRIRTKTPGANFATYRGSLVARAQ